MKGITLNKTWRSVAAPVAAALLWSLAGCDRITGAGDQAKTNDDTAGVMIDAVNYNHDVEFKYTLYELSGELPRAVGGAIVAPLASGGEKNCCLALPNKWRPDMKVRIEWEEAVGAARSGKYRKELAIPRYDTPSDLYVVFYAEHEVELVVSFGEPGHPQWNGRIKQTPWDLCVQEFGRKTCKRAIPNYGGASPREMQGFCTYLMDEYHDLSLCETAMRRCVRDFEDEEFCKSTLWGKRKPKS